MMLHHETILVTEGWAVLAALGFGGMLGVRVLVAWFKSWRGRWKQQ